MLFPILLNIKSSGPYGDTIFDPGIKYINHLYDQFFFKVGNFNDPASVFLDKMSL